MITRIDHEKCTGCGICVDVCPLDTLRLDPFQKEIPPCQEACPAGVDIRGYISLLKLGMRDKAIRLLRQYLPFPAITGRICYHPCESKCARKNVDEAVNIRGVERYLADFWLHERAEPMPLMHAAKVAVIGSGPAGISAAYFLKGMGYGVTVFETGPEIGGMLRDVVREKRLPRNVLTAQLRYIKDMGVEFKTDCTFGRDFTVDNLKDNRYKAVFLAMGFQPSHGPLPSDGIVTNEGKTIIVDPVTLETSVAGVFAGGGLLKGRAPVVKVIASAKKASTSIDRYLKGEDLKYGREKEVKEVKTLPKQGMRQMSRQEMSRETTFSEEVAMKEIHRCMSCGSKAYIAHPEDCMTCFECEIECPSGAIDVHPFKEQLPLSLPIS